MYRDRQVAVLIAAGGVGARLGADRPKQFMEIEGRSMLQMATLPFVRSEFVDRVIVIAAAGTEAETEPEIAALPIDAGRAHAADRIVQISLVTGGADRAESIRNGLAAAAKIGISKDDLVLIHDAARPYVTEAVIARVLDAAYEYGAAVPAVPVKDTIYATSELGFAASVPDRKQLFAVQTPQGFEFSLIFESHEKAFREGAVVTDDGMPVLLSGNRVKIVEGDYANRKITTPEDLAPSRAAENPHRVGIGFDVHRFEAGGKLILGGIEIPFDKGLLGHSDADVLTHALMDAILGALRLGDIGKLFPDTDESYRGISSMILLKKVSALMREAGYRPENVDMTIVGERPKMAPYRSRIEKSIADALGVAPETVSVKATTTEKLGFTGREEGIGAEAIVLLVKDRG
jgi:2-C-methyl-D-erythritol 4-phosphate cytidylyltransferase/2-C-methyl-D-erythritol 2,4-cyclodiphosphate synthase